MVENCRKQIDGSCIGCPVLKEIKNWVDKGVLYQSAIDYVAPNRCPTGMSPETKINRGPTYELTSVEVVSAKGSRVEETFLLYEKPIKSG